MTEREDLPGAMGGVERVGRTVRRPAGPWTPSVNALLDHLRNAGVGRVPQVLGVEGDRAVYGYLSGRSVPSGEIVLDSVLVEAVRWLGEFHDAAESFVAGPDARWRGGRAAGSLICHNDPGTYNWLIEGGHFAALVDWDLAGPGERIDDLAFLCWTALPLDRAAPAHEVARRLELVVDAYPHVGPRGLLTAVAARMELAASRIEAGVASGDPGFARLAAAGEPHRTRERIRDFAERRSLIEAALG
jgi:hypothetical protein